ncbi:MAG: hypothetical protein ACFFCX_15980 [Candidatus Sifarchaeia archaeon]
MDSLNNEESISHDEPVFAPQKSDLYQNYVLFVHLLIAIIISILSFTGDFREWFAGTGVVTPILLVVSAFFFAIMTGINWYQDELIPYMRRSLMVQEFEIDRFLRYKRIHRFSVLLAGYLTAVICQIVWFQVANFVIQMMESVSSTGDVLYVVAFGMALLYLLIMAFFVIVFSGGVKFMFSDIKRLIEVDDQIQESIKAKRKEAKEKEEKEKEAKRKELKEKKAKEKQEKKKKAKDNMSK